MKLLEKIVVFLLVLGQFNTGFSEEFHKTKIASKQDNSSLSDFIHLLKKSLNPYVNMGEASLPSDSSKPFLILFRDLHCNYEAQLSTANALEVISRVVSNGKQETGNGLLVLTEGADGPEDTSFLGKFPDKRVREEASKKIMKEGKMTAAEFLSIARYGEIPIQIEGVEDAGLYVENLKAFQEVMGKRQQTDVFVEAAEHVIKELKAKTFSQKLLEIDMKEKEFEKGSIKLEEYAKCLESQNTQSLEQLEQYVNLRMFLDLLSRQKNISSENVEEEKNKVIEQLSKKLSKEELSLLIQQSLKLRLEKVAQEDYFGILEELIKKNLKSEKYPNLITYISIVKKQSELNHELLLDEIHAFSERLTQSFALTKDEKNILLLDKNLSILKQMFHLEITRENLKFLKEHRQLCQVEGIIEQLKKCAVKFEMTLPEVFNSSEKIQELSNVFRESERFYNLALKRDEVMASKALKAVDGRLWMGNRDLKKNSIEIGQSTIHYPQITTLITGGFHSEGIANILKKQGVGFIVLTPKAAQPQNMQNYFNLMMDTKVRVTALDFFHIFGKKLAERFPDMSHDLLTEMVREFIRLGRQYGITPPQFYAWLGQIKGTGPDAIEKFKELIDAKAKEKHAQIKDGLSALADIVYLDLLYAKERGLDQEQMIQLAYQSAQARIKAFSEFGKWARDFQYGPNPYKYVVFRYVVDVIDELEAHRDEYAQMVSEYFSEFFKEKGINGFGGKTAIYQGICRAPLIGKSGFRDWREIDQRIKSSRQSESRTISNGPLKIENNSIPEDTNPVLSPPYVAYSMELKKQVNPDNKPLVAVYGGAGADVSSFLLSTNAIEGYFVEGETIDAKELKRWIEKDWGKIELNDGYMQRKRFRGFGESRDLLMHRDLKRPLEYRIAQELKAMGINPKTVHISEQDTNDRKNSFTGSLYPKKCVKIEFDWTYPGAQENKYSITYIPENVFSIATYHHGMESSLLDNVLGKGIDVYYQRAGVDIAEIYEHLMPVLGKVIRPGGCIVSDNCKNNSVSDRESGIVDPKPFLEGGGDKFEVVSPTLLMDWWTVMMPSSTPYGSKMNVYRKEFSGLLPTVKQDDCTGQGGLIGKLFLDSAGQQIAKGSISATESNGVVSFTTTEGDPLYDKNGNLAQAQLIKRPSTALSSGFSNLDGRTRENFDREIPEGSPMRNYFLSFLSTTDIKVMKLGSAVRGFSDGKALYLTEDLLNNPIALFHELAEGYYAEHLETLPGRDKLEFSSLSAHTYLRGAGKEVRNLPNLQDYSDPELLIDYIREKLSPNRYNRSEFALIRWNASKGRRGQELLYGLQDFVFGERANDHFSWKLEQDLSKPSISSMQKLKYGLSALADIVYLDLLHAKERGIDQKQMIQLAYQSAQARIKAFNMLGKVARDCEIMSDNPYQYLLFRYVVDVIDELEAYRDNYAKIIQEYFEELFAEKGVDSLSGSTAKTLLYRGILREHLLGKSRFKEWKKAESRITAVQKLGSRTISKGPLNLKDEVDIPAEANYVLAVPYVGYSIELKNQINPDDKPLVAIYGGAGADISSFLLSTNSTESYFVEHSPIDAPELKRLIEEEWRNISLDDEYMQRKRFRGFGEVTYLNDKPLAYRIVQELKALGVNRNTISISDQNKDNRLSHRHNNQKYVKIEFNWTYPGTGISQKYSISYIPESVVRIITYSPETENSLLDKVLGRGIDVYYQRAGLHIAELYPSLMPVLGKVLRPGGCVVSDDCKNDMESGLDCRTVDPKPFLEKGGDKFEVVSPTLLMDWWTVMMPSCTPYGSKMNVLRKKGSSSVEAFDATSFAKGLIGSWTVAEVKHYPTDEEPYLALALKGLNKNQGQTRENTRVNTRKLTPEEIETLQTKIIIQLIPRAKAIHDPIKRDHVLAVLNHLLAYLEHHSLWLLENHPEIQGGFGDKNIICVNQERFFFDQGLEAVFHEAAHSYFDAYPKVFETRNNKTLFPTIHQYARGLGKKSRNGRKVSELKPEERGLQDELFGDKDIADPNRDWNKELYELATLMQVLSLEGHRSRLLAAEKWLDYLVRSRNESEKLIQVVAKQRQERVREALKILAGRKESQVVNIYVNDQVAGGVLGCAKLIAEALIHSCPQIIVNIYVFDKDFSPNGFAIASSREERILWHAMSENDLFDKGLHRISQVHIGVNVVLDFKKHLPKGSIVIESKALPDIQGRQQKGSRYLPKQYKYWITHDLEDVYGTLFLDPHLRQRALTKNFWNVGRLVKERSHWLEHIFKSESKGAQRENLLKTLATREGWDPAKAIWTWGYFQDPKAFLGEIVDLTKAFSLEEVKKIPFAEGGRQLLFHLIPGKSKLRFFDAGHLSEYGITIITDWGEIIEPDDPSRRVPITVILYDSIENDQLKTLQCELSGTAVKQNNRWIGFPAFVTGTASWLEAISSGAITLHDGYDTYFELKKPILVSTLIRMIALEDEEKGVERSWDELKAEAEKRVGDFLMIWSEDHSVKYADLEAWTEEARRYSDAMFRFNTIDDILIEMAKRVELDEELKSERLKTVAPQNIGLETGIIDQAA